MQKNKYGILQSTLYFCAISLICSIVMTILCSLWGDKGRMTFLYGALSGCAISYYITSFFICKNKTVAIVRALLCCVLTPCFIYLFGIIFHSFSPLSQELLGVSMLTTPLVSWMLVDVLIMCWKPRSNNHEE